MKLHKNLNDFVGMSLRKSDLSSKCIFKTGTELWDEEKSNNGKSIYQTGVNPDKNIQLHRMEADRLEQAADRIANMSVYATLSGDHMNSKKLADQAEELRRLSDMHRRQSRL
jgi:hypothetical protein